MIVSRLELGKDYIVVKEKKDTIRVKSNRLDYIKGYISMMGADSKVYKKDNIYRADIAIDDIGKLILDVDFSDIINTIDDITRERGGECNMDTNIVDRSDIYKLIADDVEKYDGEWVDYMSEIDWAAFISAYASDATGIVSGETSPKIFETNMIRVAALAVAAIEASRRQYSDGDVSAKEINNKE